MHSRVHSNQRHVADYCPCPFIVNNLAGNYNTHTHTHTHLIDIIKKYNPDVKGFSVKYGDETSSNARNNVAISGATAVWAVSVMLHAVEPFYKDTWNEDISFSWDTWSCPKGVQNRGVPLYIISLNFILLARTLC